MDNKYVYSAIVLILVVYLLFATWQLSQVEPPLELPLTQEVAEDIGEKLLYTSFPDLFHQETEEYRLDTKTTTVDKGDSWEVVIYHEPHLIKLKGGRKLKPLYASNYVVLDKETGDVIRFGFYE